MFVARELEDQIAMVGWVFAGDPKGAAYLSGKQILKNLSIERASFSYRRLKTTVKKMNLKGAENQEPLTCNWCCFIWLVMVLLDKVAI